MNIDALIARLHAMPWKMNWEELIRAWAAEQPNFKEHTEAVSEFLRSMYAILVDPVEDPTTIRVSEMCKILLDAAIAQRNSLAEQCPTCGGRKRDRSDSPYVQSGGYCNDPFHEPAQQSNLLRVCAEAYQFIGALARESDLFESPQVQHALDVLDAVQSPEDPEKAKESMLPAYWPPKKGSAPVTITEAMARRKEDRCPACTSVLTEYQKGNDPQPAAPAVTSTGPAVPGCGGFGDCVLDAGHNGDCKFVPALKPTVATESLRFVCAIVTPHYHDCKTPAATECVCPICGFRHGGGREACPRIIVEPASPPAEDSCPGCADRFCECHCPQRRTDLLHTCDNTHGHRCEVKCPQCPGFPAAVAAPAEERVECIYCGETVHDSKDCPTPCDDEPTLSAEGRALRAVLALCLRVQADSGVTDNPAAVAERCIASAFLAAIAKELTP